MRRKIMHRYAALLSAALLLAAPAARADIITETIDFSATGFYVTSPPYPSPPYDQVSGSVTLSFNPAVYSTGPVISFSSTLPAAYNSPISYSFTPGGSFGTLYVGNASCFGSGYCANPNPPPDYLASSTLLDIVLASSQVVDYAYVNYTPADGSAVFFNDDPSFTFTTVPEPATLALLVPALAALGFARAGSHARRRLLSAS